MKSKVLAGAAALLLVTGATTWSHGTSSRTHLPASFLFVNQTVWKCASRSSNHVTL